MANIRINDLPSDAAPNATDVVPIDGLTTRKTTLADLVNAARPIASQAEAEAGTDNAKTMTPLTTKQAIEAIGGGLYATTEQGALADTAVQPGDLATVATTGNYNDLTNRPTLGSAAAQDVSAFASAAQAVPAGGTTGQVLAKTSNANYAVGWADAGAGDMLRDVYDPRGLDADAFPYSSKAEAESATIPNTVPAIRLLGYASAGDGGYALYKRAVSEPSHPGKLQSADGSWWELANRTFVNVKALGAKGDGVTDDYAAIVAAYNVLPDTGGTIWLPPSSSGFYAITQPLSLGNGAPTQVSTKQNIILAGAEIQGNADQVLAPVVNKALNRIIYTGAAQAPFVIRFAGPISCSMRGVSIDGNANAAIGLLVEHAFRSKFSDIFVYRCMKGIRSYATCQDVGLISCGDADNTWERVHTSNMIQNGTVGLDLGNDDMPGNLCSSRNVWLSCAFLVSDHPDSTARVLRGADNNQFSNCMFYVHGERSGTTTAYIAPENAAFKHLPFENMDENCAYMGKWYYSPDWDVDSLNSHVNSFFPLNSGDLLDPTKANVGTLPDRKGFFGFDSRGYFLGRPVLEGFFNGQMSSVPAVIYKRRAQITVQNTTAQTTIAAKTIAGQLLRARRSGAFNSPSAWYYDRQLRIRASGYYLNNSGGNVDLTFKVIFANAVIFETTALVGSAAGERAWSFEGEFSSLDDGTMQEMMGRFELGQSGSVGLVAAGPDIVRVQRRRDITENLAIDGGLFITVTHGTASTSVFLVCRVATIELL